MGYAIGQYNTKYSDNWKNLTFNGAYYTSMPQSGQTGAIFNPAYYNFSPYRYQGTTYPGTNQSNFFGFQYNGSTYNPTLGSSVYPQTNYLHNGALNYPQTTTKHYETTEEYNARIQRESEEMKARIHATTEEAIDEMNMSLEEAAGTIVLSRSQREGLVEHENDKKRKENIKAEGAVLGTLAFNSLFCAGKLKRACKTEANAPIKEMFFEYDNATSGAKHAGLFKDTPITMQEAQEEMSKASQQFSKRRNKLQKRINRLANRGRTTTRLEAELIRIEKDYNLLKNNMQKALNSGRADNVAKALEQTRAANRVSYKKLARKGTSKIKIAKAANIKDVKAVMGNKLFHHMGGKIGIIGAIVASASIFWTDSERIKNAYSEDKTTGRKQLALTTGKALASGGGYILADALTRKAITSIISKGAGKIAAKVAGKLAAKGAGKIIGVALGHLIPVPGLNLILGLTMGALIDLGIRKLMACIENPGDKVANKKLKSDELIARAYQDKLNGVELDPEIEKILNNNKTYCTALENEAARQQQALTQQGQTA